jgi:hypothetical protein
MLSSTICKNIDLETLFGISYHYQIFRIITDTIFSTCQVKKIMLENLNAGILTSMRFQQLLVKCLSLTVYRNRDIRSYFNRKTSNFQWLMSFW